eukprot:COSAG02_NODE_22995_length_733_cov_0.842271_1_plen_114_part_10
MKEPSCTTFAKAPPKICERHVQICVVKQMLIAVEDLAAFEIVLLSVVYSASAIPRSKSGDLSFRGRSEARRDNGVAVDVRRTEYADPQRCAPSVRGSVDRGTLCSIYRSVCGAS